MRGVRGSLCRFKGGVGFLYSKSVYRLILSDLRLYTLYQEQLGDFDRVKRYTDTIISVIYLIVEMARVAPASCLPYASKIYTLSHLSRIRPRFHRLLL